MSSTKNIYLTYVSPLMAYKKGVEYIDNMNMKQNKKYCVIFDIDDTIIDISRDKYKKDTNGYNDKIIIPIYNLYEYAKKKGITVIFVTARPGYDYVIKETEKELEHHNISYHDVFFMPPDMKNVELYKLFARKYINDMGYQPIFSIGDNFWDIGEYGGKGILINKNI